MQQSKSYDSGFNLKICAYNGLDILTEWSEITHDKKLVPNKQRFKKIKRRHNVFLVHYFNYQHHFQIGRNIIEITLGTTAIENPIKILKSILIFVHSWSGGMNSKHSAIFSPFSLLRKPFLIDILSIMIGPREKHYTLLTLIEEISFPTLFLFLFFTVSELSLFFGNDSWVDLNIIVEN